MTPATNARSSGYRRPALLVLGAGLLFRPDAVPVDLGAAERGTAHGGGE